MTDNVAVLDGFTKEIMAYTHSLGPDLHLMVRPDDHLDGRFRAWCCDEQEYIMVNGWMYDIEDTIVHDIEDIDT